MAEIKMVDGMPFPPFPESNYYLLKHLPLRHGDVLLSTYPKCGTNWLSYILWSIYHPEEEPPEGNSVLLEEIPFVDKYGLGSWADTPEDQPRILSTHMPSGRLSDDSCAKYIIVLRNPFDCLVSLFHFLRDRGCNAYQTSGDKVPDVIFEKFITGDVIYGDYFVHTKGWYDRRNEPNVYVLNFEELKKNSREEILKISRFLGLHKKLEEDKGSLLDKIVNQTSFGYMKKNIKYTDIKEFGQNDLKLLRKGKVGGFHDSLSDEQIRRLTEKMEDVFKGTDLLKMWRQL